MAVHQLQVRQYMALIVAYKFEELNASEFYKLVLMFLLGSSTQEVYLWVNKLFKLFITSPYMHLVLMWHADIGPFLNVCISC